VKKAMALNEAGTTVQRVVKPKPALRMPADLQAALAKNRKALAVELERAFARRTTQEWVELLNAKGVPSGPILDVKQVYENEQIRHLKMAVPVKHPALGELLVQAPPVTLSRTPGGVRLPAPDTGEHSDEILAELGYSPADITSLRSDKVI